LSVSSSCLKMTSELPTDVIPYTLTSLSDKELLNLHGKTRSHKLRNGSVQVMKQRLYKMIGTQFNKIEHLIDNINYRHLFISALKIQTMTDGWIQPAIGRVYLKYDGKIDKYDMRHVDFKKAEVAIEVSKGDVWKDVKSFLDANKLINPDKFMMNYIRYSDVLVDIPVFQILVIYAILGSKNPIVSIDNNKNDSYGSVIPYQLEDFSPNADIRCSICDSSAKLVCSDCNEYFCGNH